MFQPSEYAKRLCHNDFTDYIQKLTLPNGQVLPDPYSILSLRWMNELSEWPSLSNPDIYNYFVHGSRLYSQDEMKNPKSLDGFQYFVAGHVQPVTCLKLENSDHIYLRAKVLPSQRQGTKTKLYDTFIVTNTIGQILTAHCTCMAGYV